MSLVDLGKSLGTGLWGALMESVDRDVVETLKAKLHVACGGELAFFDGAYSVDVLDAFEDHMIGVGHPVNMKAIESVTEELLSFGVDPEDIAMIKMMAQPSRYSADFDGVERPVFGGRLPEVNDPQIDAVIVHLTK